MASGVELKDSERVAGVAMSFPACDYPSPSSSPSKLPRRLRRRLLAESKSPSTAEEIDAKLKEADLRRQQFYDSLSSKARPKQRSPSWSSSQDTVLNQRLEAKLNAAEQKRLSILAKARERLSKLDELRQAAKSGVEMRFEKERDELGMKVESRVQQAEAKRLLILRTNRQLRAARKERTAQSLMRRMIQESKYKECVRTAIHQKRLAAERKRLGFLEAERSRAHDRLLRVRRAAHLVHTQGEIQRMKKKNELEERLQKAKRRRAEILKHRIGLHCSRRASTRVVVDQAEPLVRKLARCWRRFVSLSGSTYSLTKAFEDLNIDGESVKTMPFEKLALQIESDMTLQVVKSLLERLEIRLIAQQETGNGSLSRLENINHLLKRVASPRRVESTHERRSRGIKRGDLGKEGTQSQHKLSRYQVRVVLCAYMILGHPDAVLSGKGDHENALAESAAKFIQEFELLIEIIMGRRDVAFCKEKSSTERTFRSQLEAFDKAWCAYLYCFVVWKVKDAKLLEQDLVRAACQLELSMMHTCKMTPEGDTADLTHDMKAIQKQVMEDQRLLKEKVQNLSGSAGIERMECAISDTRSKYFASKEVESPIASPVIHIASPSFSGSEGSSPVSFNINHVNLAGSEGSGGVARSLFKDVDPSSGKVVDASSTRAGGADGELRIGDMVIPENELLVNEIVHGHRHGFADNLDSINEGQSNIKEKVMETMEKAFWDGVMESFKQADPDYTWVLKLVTEVRDELCEIAPSGWKQEIVDTIDVDILSQVLTARTLNMNYLGRILEFALVTLRKLSAPSSDDEMKAAHQNLLRELAEVSECGDDYKSSFAMAMFKGLKFVLQQIQALKKGISKARITLIEPLIKGPAGLEYLQKAFSCRFGPPSEVSTSLPLTMRWLSSVKPESEQEWDEHVDSLLALSTTTRGRQAQGLPSNALRTGGSVLSTLKTLSGASSPESLNSSMEQPECTGEKIDLLVRLGLLKMVSAIEGLTTETLAETLTLNVFRLRSVQHMLQKVMVISTSMLVLRQALLAEDITSSPSQLETIVSQSINRLSKLLDKLEDESVSEIIQALFEVEELSNLFPSPEKRRSLKEIVANMLAKSLQSGDPIFTRVSRVIYLAMRALVLVGTGIRGQALADVVLRRIGATSLAEKLVEAAEIVVVVASVSESIHGAWYAQLLKEI